MTSRVGNIIPISEQHAFLECAKEFDWAEVKRRIGANPALVGVQPCGKDGTVRWSALHQAAFGGDADAVLFLLENNAAVDAKTNDGKTPLDVAKNERVKTILRNFTAVLGHSADPEKVADLRKVPTPLRARVAAPKTMKAGKGSKGIKAMKVMKSIKARSKIAKGKRGKVLVYKGRFEKTVGGLTKDQLVRNKAGKIVSKQMQARGKKAHANIKGWVEAMTKARVELGLSGFVTVKTGSPLYAKTKELYQS